MWLEKLVRVTLQALQEYRKKKKKRSSQCKHFTFLALFLEYKKMKVFTNTPEIACGCTEGFLVEAYAVCGPLAQNRSPCSTLQYYPVVY